MASQTWVEIPEELGAALWSVYRKEMRPEGVVGVHETFSDPEGGWGRPTMMTVVGHDDGAPLLRLETTWDNEPVFEDGRVAYCKRKNEETRYWLPGEYRDDY